MFLKIYIHMKLILFIVLGFVQFGVLAQQPTNNTSLLIADLKGEPLFTGNGVNVAGTPFYHQDWVIGDIILNNGKKYDRVNLRINLETDRIHYLVGPSKVENVASSGVVLGVSFIDPNTKAATKFQCGFPEIDNNDLITYYQLLSEGKITLLKQMKKILIEEKPFNSASINRRYDTDKGYYAFVNNSMTKIKRSKSGLIELMADQEEKVKNFISANKLVLKEDADLAKVFDYYNSIK